MLLAWIRARRARKQGIERDAAELLDRHGPRGAWQVIDARCRDRQLSDADRAVARRVRSIIEKRLGMPPRVDTATRYVDTD